MKHVIYIDHAPKIGGASNVLMYLVNNLGNSDIVPVIVCPTGSDTAKYFNEEGFPTYTTNIPWFSKKAGILDLFSYFISLIAFAIFLRRLTKKYRPALIHANSFITALYAMIPARITGTPLVWHMHDILDSGIINKIFIRAAGWGARRIICVSAAVRNSLLEFGVNGGKCKIVYNCLTNPLIPSQGVKARKEFGIPSGTHLVGMIGTICRLKGQLVLAEAIKDILARFPSTVFMFVGDVISDADIPYKEKVLNYLQENGLKDNVIFTGFRKDVVDLIAAMDIIVHPPIMPESFGLVILEAMACKKPVVASNTGGIPEIISDGLNGLLIQPGDVHALANAVCKLLDDPDLRVKIGETGNMILIDKFRPEKFISGILVVYEELLQNVD
jgi:glycosyltransferase involved in cell wall biosynthesis